ncbi:E3 ubiquitin-protein ligase SINA-like 10 isoform X1 [Hordeum vulgare subsp. vulgare]|uniref:SIAH-type domain-containing protein n=2 Tax=Hordeum vulgare subsp. vulgare TaxID=112509 RepID=A0A8I6YRP0_HORVV|nr:E3 ubiquitin-protein ligase SINA-like 10 isoform X1 [Hordeum vulgare subsp. vulgare]
MNGTGMMKQSTKKARTAPVIGGRPDVPRGRGEETVEESANAYTVEADGLGCEICFEPFGDQIFMCKNGHPACGTCCIRMDRICFCAEPIGDIRCRPLEKVLAAMTRPCTYASYGCREIVSYTGRRSHEEDCPYTPYYCPFDGCTYHGMQLYNHIHDRHAASAVVVPTGSRRVAVRLEKKMPFRVLLHGDGARVFLLLNGGEVLSGRSLSLVCMSPRPMGKAEARYKMEVKHWRSAPDTPVLLSSGAAPLVRRLKDFQARGFLFVPDSYWNIGDTVSVTVHLTDGW